jgi:hypothetical protein
VKKSSHLDGLLQPGSGPEELEGGENQAIVAAVIEASLAQADPPKAPALRDCKRLHRPLVVEVVIVLASADSVDETPSSDPSITQLFR